DRRAAEQREGPKPHHLGRELVKLAKMISPVARSSTANHSSSASGSSRGTAFSSWASSKEQKCVGLRHTRDPQPATNASPYANLMIGRGSRPSWASPHKARQRATASSRLSGGFLTLPACSTRSSTWSSLYTWSMAARTTRSRSVDWASCNPHRGNVQRLGYRRPRQYPFSIHAT